MILSRAQIDEFINNGVLVVDNVLTESEISEARAGFHATLLSHNVDVNNLEATGAALKDLSSTDGAGGVVNIFYPAWRMKVIENERLLSIICQLWECTYASSTHPLFTHPLGAFNAYEPLFMMDRCCYRVPDSIAQLHGKRKNKPLQRSLSPHLDCNGLDLFGSYMSYNECDPPRWRPIQATISLSMSTIY